VNKKFETILIFVFLVIFTIITIYPVLNVIGISLRSENAFNTKSLLLFDKSSSLKTYIQLFTQTDFLLWIRNSFIVSISVTLLGVILASTSAYALSRFDFKGRKFGMVAIITTQMFPATMLLLPFFILLSKLSLLNSFFGLMIIYSSTVLPFCIWQMKGFYDTIPKALEESARLDGCNYFQAFYKIVLPLSTPALVITALFSFMSSWSEYVVAAIVLQNPQLYTLPLGLKTFQSSLATEWGLYAAGAIIVSIPVIILFISLSKYLVSGLTLGGVKG
jgi:arabinogalactan oligomer/maltooligosaccharide transport system permease protein